MNDDMMNENDQGGGNPTPNNNKGTTAGTSIIQYENESSQQNENNNNVQPKSKKTKLDGNNSSVSVLDSPSSPLRHKSPHYQRNNVLPSSPSVLLTSPSLVRARNNNRLANYSSSSTRLGLPKDDRKYEQSGNNNNNTSLLLDDDNNKEGGLLQLAESKLDRKKSRKKSRKNRKKLDATHWMKNIAEDLASMNDEDNNNDDEEHYLALQLPMKHPKRGTKNPSHNAGVYMAPPKSTNNNNCENTIDTVPTKTWSNYSIKEKSTHFLTNIANDLGELSNISQVMKDEIMSLSTNTEMNQQGPNARQDGVGFAKGNTLNKHVFTTSGGKGHNRIYKCYHNNELAFTGVSGTAKPGGADFPIFNLLKSTLLSPGSNRTVLDVIGSSTESALMNIFRRHSGENGPHQRANQPLLGSLMITKSENGRYLANEVGPKEAFGLWVEAVKVYDKEMRSSEILGFSATTPSLRNLAVLKEEHLGAIVDQFTRRTNALPAAAQEMLVAVYEFLRIAIREFGSQRQLSGNKEKPSLQEVIPIVTTAFTNALVQNAVTVDSGMSFIAVSASVLPEEIIGDLNSAEKKKLNVTIFTGRFDCAIAPLSSQPLTKAQITALIVVLKKFGFGDKSISNETRRNTIMGICKFFSSV